MENGTDIFAFLSLASAVICLFAGGYVYSLRPADRKNQLFTILCIISTYWAFTEFLVRVAGTASEARFWMEMGFLWPFSIAVIVHFVLIYTKHTTWLDNRWIILSLYPVALLFSGLEIGTDLITHGVRKTYWGYGLVPSDSWVSWTCNLWDVGWILFSLVLLIRYHARTIERQARIQTRLIVLGLSIPLVGATLTESVFFDLNIPEMNCLMTGISCLLVGYGIWKYGLFRLDPAITAESIVASMIEGVLLTDGRGKISFCNRSLLLMLGYPREEIEGKSMEMLFARIEVKDEILEKVSRNCVYTDFGLRLKSRTGSEIPVHVFCSSLKKGRKKIAGVLVICRDISARLEMEEALRKSEERYRSLVNNSPDLIYELDAQGNLKAVNENAIKSMGYVGEADVIGRSFAHFVHPDDRDKVIGSFLEMIRTKRRRTTGLVFRLLDGSGNAVWSELYATDTFDENGNYIEETGIVRDITERMKAQEEKERIDQETLQAQKMQAVGTLAGGIAHDFNNILAIINGHAELLLMEETADEFIRSEIKNILQAGWRGRALAQQILTFSSAGGREMSPVDVCEIAREAIRFLRATLPTTVLIAQRIECENAWILGNSTQINQVFINLCTNAADAMRVTGGTLEIGLSHASVSPDEMKIRGLSHPGSFLSLTVRDTGHGMDDKIRERIFEPFFTTKGKEKGTGLGLAVVHGIVKRHGGHIACWSEPGKGTLFEILMPRHQPEMPCEKAPKDELPSRFESVPKSPESQRLGHILFVDDEKQIVRVHEQLLQRLGYKTTMRTSSVRALEDFRNDPNNFDLVITDMTMPNVNGLELAREILRIRPDIPIILCTGFNELSNSETVREAGIRELLTKPVPMRELVNTINGLLAVEHP